MDDKCIKGLVSIIVPCYNVAPFIKRCLASILNNSYRNLEIICVNDGSSDNTLELLQGEKDERVTVINQTNQGVSVARNAGLEAACGEFISFVDPDDWVHKEFFQRLVDAQKLTDADVVMCDYLRVEEFVPDSEIKTPVSPVIYKGIDAWNNTSYKNYIWRKLYKRSFLSTTKFLKRAKIGEDLLYNVETFVANPNALYVSISDKLLYYYNRPGSLIRTFSGDELLPIIDEMSKAISVSDSNLAVVPSTEVLKFGLAARYLSMFDPNYKEVKSTCSSYFTLALKHLRGNISKGEYFKYSNFVKFPFLYRGFRILTDRTMLDWEKKQKAKYSKN